MSAPAKKTDRTELSWVQFQREARTSPSEAVGVEFVMSTDATKIFLGEVDGIRCVFFERPGSKTGRVPLTNVASFGVVE